MSTGGAHDVRGEARDNAPPASRKGVSARQQPEGAKVSPDTNADTLLPCHTTVVRSVTEGEFRHGAYCGCGWSGPWRRKARTARRDSVRHEGGERLESAIRQMQSGRWDE